MESSPGSRVVIGRAEVGTLIAALDGRGYRVVGPTVQDGAIVYDTIERMDDLPIGWTDRQDGGSYRLEKRRDQALFGYVVGPRSLKNFLHPPRRRLWRAERTGDRIVVTEDDAAPERLAFLGVRSCELHAMAIQDRVFIEGPYPDRDYAARRAAVFIVAINCAEAGGTCFCVSMETGPKATRDFDLALTELLDAGRHEFLVEIGSEAGAEVMREVPARAAGADDIAAAEQAVARAAGEMGRQMDTSGIKALLQDNQEHPRWDDVAGRCLTCANCTMVCPTCFCSTVEEVTDLEGDHAERWLRWDSCFTMDFSYIHGGSIRTAAKARYRQWMSHKLAHWIDQFGTSGCVGCGRCITWCPVGIDITEEVAAIRASLAPPEEPAR